MKLETLTEKLTVLADHDLKREIEQATNTLDSLLRDGCIWPPVNVMVEAIDAANGRKEVKVMGEVLWTNALEGLKSLAFEKRKESRRQARIDEFLAKVNEIDDLRRKIE